MSQKLIDGNLTIEDRASAALSEIEKALKNIEKVAQPVTKQMEQLNKEVAKFQNFKGVNVPEVTGFKDLSRNQKLRLVSKSIANDIEISKIEAKSAAKRSYFDRVDQTIQERAINRLSSITQVEGLRMIRQEDLFKRQAEQSLLNNKLHSSQIMEKEASQKRVIDYKRELAAKDQQAKMEQRLAQQEEKLAQQAESRTDWQKRMDALAAKNGRLAPLWKSLGKVSSPIGVARSPHLVAEGVGGISGGFGKIAKGLGGFATGRLIGGMLGSASIGGVLGSVAGGPLGVIVGVLASALMAGFSKLSDGIRKITDILNEIATERATESTSLRRKMQMSSEMFGIDPRDVSAIDKKIYGLRAGEQAMYKHGLAGRDITTSAIDWLHLLGTKESGGVFKDEQQAFDFSKALSAIAKMNGLTDQEYETVRYQGMQILSKGYADILDVKPLLNSAPGFVRDLLAQTGMSRQQFLESGRTHEFTSDKFIEALMGVEKYYEVLSDRASSRTVESQDEAAKNIIGAAAVWDEMYTKAKAESNQRVTDAVIQGGIAEDIKKTWYQMWATSNDAQDGILNKVSLEKELTYRINLLVLDIYTLCVLIKNTFDMVFNVATTAVDAIGQTILTAFMGIGYVLNNILSGILNVAGEIPGLGKLKEAGEYINPDSGVRRRERAGEDLSEKMVEQIYEDYNKHGAKFVESKYASILNVGYKVPGIVPGVTLPDNIKSNLTGRIGDLLYENKETELFADKDKLKDLVKSNMGQFVDDNGNFLYGVQNMFDLKHSNVEDYTWGNVMQDNFTGLAERTVNKFKTDVDDIERHFETRDRIKAEAERAYQNVKSPYVDKQVAQDVHDIKVAQVGSNAKILDVLKEIAGITVINKVTKVRPDVVFNYGSYGRNGKSENPNFVGTGDLRQLAMEVTALADTYDDEDELVVNGTAF